MRVLLAGLLLLVACAPPEPGRVLIVGIDGASPRLIEPLLREGRLPTLGRLAREGSWGWLRTHVRPVASPVVWTTVATGKLPVRHGIFGFLRPNPGGGQRLYESGDRRSHALWNILSDAGLRVGVVNWWTTFPPEIIDGVVVTDHALPDAMEKMADFVGAPRVETGGVIAHPTEWIGKTRRIMAADPLPDLPADPFSAPSSLPDRVHFGRLGQHYANDLRTLAVALALEEEESPDSLLVLLFGIDRVCHVLWRYVEPDWDYPESLRPRPEDIPAGRALLERYVEVTDALLGRLIERFDLTRDLVVILSDHGFEAGVTRDLPMTGSHDSVRAEMGVFFMAGAGVKAGGRVDDATTLDVTPTVLNWLGLPVGADMDGHALTNFFPDDPRFQSPPPPIATHDIGVIHRAEVTGSGAEEAIQEQLRSLGYIE